MVPCIKAVQIRNYKSLAQVRVTDLGPFTVLVGPNATGKSNFINALAFVKECLSSSIELAFRNRGGIGAVRRRSGGHPTHIEFRIYIELADGHYANYNFRIAARPTEKFVVAWERCQVQKLMQPEHVFEVQDGRFIKEIPGIRPKITGDRLALPVVSAIEEFRPIYDFLTSMRFYSIDPVQLRELQDSDPGDVLKRDGSNAAAVLKRISEQSNERYERICGLLPKVAYGIEGVHYKSVGKKETLEFKLDVGLEAPWSFDALNMSDGTLRVLGILLALYQPGNHTLVAIEEPEATLHPAAAEVIVQALADASQERQILITTHSPDIINSEYIKESYLRAVSMEGGRTIISPLSQSTRDAILEGLYTPGELLSRGELTPDTEAAKTSALQLQSHWPNGGSKAK